jgi:hypothetical protein
MTYGLQIFTAAGKINTDTTQLPSTLIDVFRTSGSSGSVTYPSYAGSNIYVNNFAVGQGLGVGSIAPLTITIDYSLGYPRVSWSQGTGNLIYPDRQVFVFLQRL